jgi:shikimate kinase
VWLVVGERELVRRLRRDRSRPSVTGLGVVREVRPLLRRRRPLYRALAAISIRCGRATPRELAHRVIRSLAARGIGNLHGPSRNRSTRVASRR